MCFFDLDMLFDYWADYPPANEILAAVHGIKPRDKSRAEAAPVSADDPSGIGGLIASFPNGFVPAGR